MSFADAEIRVSEAVMRRLSNASATIALPAVLAGQALVGIFDAAYQLVDIGSGIESNTPVFTVADSAMPSALSDALEAGDAAALEIRGTTYSVVEAKPDGTGVTLMRLRK